MNINTVPSLRQPKSMLEKPKEVLNEVKNMIVTLKDQKCLVVSSDAYNGIICRREIFKCVFCRSETVFNNCSKEFHKKSDSHLNNLRNYPLIDEYGHHLARKLDKDNYYCTHCNVIVTLPFLSRHFSTEVHTQQLEKALTKALIYKPLN